VLAAAAGTGRCMVLGVIVTAVLMAGVSPSAVLVFRHFCPLRLLNYIP
jgi:ATP-dependent exoDNAse (exonuclease V) beta subunit